MKKKSVLFKLCRRCNNLDRDQVITPIEDSKLSYQLKWSTQTSTIEVLFRDYLVFVRWRYRLPGSVLVFEILDQKVTKYSIVCVHGRIIVDMMRRGRWGGGDIDGSSTRADHRQVLDTTVQVIIFHFESEYLISDGEIVVSLPAITPLMS